MFYVGSAALGCPPVRPAVFEFRKFYPGNQPTQRRDRTMVPAFFLCHEFDHSLVLRRHNAQKNQNGPIQPGHIFVGKSTHARDIHATRLYSERCAPGG
jgi:hypothetical protein